MSLPVKLGIGTVALGSTIGAGYAGVSYFSKENKKDTKQQLTTISQLIENKFKYVLLNTTTGENNPDKKYWDVIWTNYQRDNAAGKDVFKLGGWADRGNNNLTDKLKEKCASLATSNEESLYENVTKYCARGITVEDEARRDRLEILDTTTTGHNKIWGQRHTAKDSMTVHLKNLEITSNKPDGSDIKAGCEKAKEKNKQANNYETIYASYKLVCTKQPTNTEI